MFTTFRRTGEPSLNAMSHFRRPSKPMNRGKGFDRSKYRQIGRQRVALKKGGKLKPGKRMKKWAKVRKSLKVEFEAVGITACELGLEGCTGNDGLGFAHALKRRNIKEIESAPVLLLCNSCHWQIEKLGEAEMNRRVMERIGKRNEIFS